MIAAVKDISSTDTLTAAIRPVRVLMAAGGTGGHVYPAISIAKAILRKQPDADILFVGTKDRMEWQAVPNAGFDIKSIWISGFHRRFTVQNLLFPLKLAVSLVQSFLIISRFKPDVLIACGGFAAGPAGWIASRLKIPVILQEQNSFPGVTNRMLARHASIIFTAFENASMYLKHSEIRLTGNPVRKELLAADKSDAYKKFNFSDQKKTVLVLGGSGGAKTINDAMLAIVENLHDQLQIQIIWQCGKKYLNDIENKFDMNRYPNVRLLAYINDMPAAYAVADLVVSRAGASSCSELMVTGTPSILVPSPNVAGDHQKKNAKSMVENNAAILLEDSEVEAKLFEKINDLIHNDKKLAEMSKSAFRLAKPDAADKIAGDVLDLLQTKSQNS